MDSLYCHNGIKSCVFFFSSTSYAYSSEWLCMLKWHMSFLWQANCVVRYCTEVNVCAYHAEWILQELSRGFGLTCSIVETQEGCIVCYWWPAFAPILWPILTGLELKTWHLMCLYAVVSYTLSVLADELIAVFSFSGFPAYWKTQKLDNNKNGIQMAIRAEKFPQT